MTDSGPYTDDVTVRLLVDGLARKGWKQVDLARALGTRPQTINKWMLGENKPPPSRWPAIEDALAYERGTFARATGIVEDVSVGDRRHPAAASGIDLSDLSAEDRARVEGFVEALRERRERR